MDHLYFILIIIVAWLLQYALTILQVRDYRTVMGRMIEEYKGLSGFHLFSGMSKKALGRRSIVLLIVDQDYQVRKCHVLSGMSVFSRFKPYAAYEGKHVCEILEQAYETVTGKKRVSKSRRSLAAAFQMAAENAVKSISAKREQALRN